jgi:ABC-type polar amino acid transport system ATPase subunit
VSIPDIETLGNVFEERAEFLSKVELEKWTANTSQDRSILSKLKAPGAKLLTGPRGSGKSTLLRQAYYEILDHGTDLPAYVNYSRSLALEPLFHQVANALQLFRQWVLFKIVNGLADAISEASVPVPEDLAKTADFARTFIRDLERGNRPESSNGLIAPSELMAGIEQWTREIGRRRCILLLDDAAHAFSPDQQREFFEIFRELRSRTVAPKAAVYPGVTSYSPNFHVGHEAEVIEAWLRPENDDYLTVMREIFDRRLPDSLKDRLRKRQELLDYLALASFGLPRGYLVMLSQLLGVEEDESRSPSRQLADQAISDHANSVRHIFLSLAEKLPRYKRFVEVGSDVESGAARAIQRFNLNKSVKDKAVTIAFPEPIGTELSRMLGMLEYAGIFRDAHTVSRGVKGVFHRYTLHYSIILDSNALSLGRSFAIGQAVRALSSRDAHAFVRTSPSRLVGSDFAARCTLDLAPCQNCDAPRVSEEAKFCMRCGRELSDASIYEELLKAPIEVLPLTRKKLQGLREHTPIRTINDILLDEENQQIRSVPHIGPVWTARIRRHADEFVSV